MKQGCNLSPSLSNMFQNDLHDIFNTSCDPVELSGKVLNSLSWADDLVLLSTSPTGLQNSLDRLDEYCHKWALCINPQKTMCMVMSKGKCRNQPKFFLQGNELTISNEVNYLGIKITHNMNTNSMIEDRIVKANRACYLLRQALSVQGNIHIKLALNLFDKMISPILLYGCCLWGLPKTTNLLYMYNLPEIGTTLAQVKRTFFRLCGKNVEINSVKRTGNRQNNTCKPILIDLKHIDDKFRILYNCQYQHQNLHISLQNVDINLEKLLYEKVHTKFLKFVLNVNKFASNVLVRGELGRFPLSLKVFSLSIKYWHKIAIGGSPNILLNHAFHSEMSICSQWLESVKYILSMNGLNNILVEPTSVSNPVLYQLARRRLEDQYIQSWFSLVSSNPKYNILNSLKHNYCCSTYLAAVHSPKIRAIFTKLRTNNSILRAYIRSTDDADKVCILCDSSEIETVEHFLLSCVKFRETRELYFMKIQDLVHNFRALTIPETLEALLSLKCETSSTNFNTDTVISTISNFIKCIYEMRLKC